VKVIFLILLYCSKNIFVVGVGLEPTRRIWISKVFNFIVYHRCRYQHSLPPPNL